MDRDQVSASTSGDPANASAFWREQLLNALPVPQLPGCRPSTPALSTAQAAVEQALPVVLAQRLQTTALQSGRPAFDWMLAGWALLLARLGGQADIVVGMLASTGNALPLRVQVDDTTRVLDLVHCVGEGVEKAQAFCDALPEGAAAAVRWMFSANAAFASLPGLDFHLQVSTEAGPFARLHYREALCEPASAERIVGQFVTVLDAMLADPAQVAARVALMTAAERHQLLVGFNDTAAEVPRDLLMHQPFEARAASQPDAPALFAGDRVLTYGELNARANRLAHRLVALGVRPNDRVAICVERSIEMIVGLLGVLKAGGAYVPLDPDYPADRLAYMVADCAPVALLTQAARQAGLPKVDIPVIALDGDAALAQQAATNPDPVALGLDAGHTAYVIYTSGSTGQPKGASVFHRGLVNLLHWYSNDYGVTAQDRALVVSSFSFDLTQKNLFVCLFAGGQLHLAGQQFDPAAIVKTVSEHAITTLNLTPSAFYALVDAHQPASFGSLRRVFLGGEPISVPRLAALGASYPLLDIVNSYGPTECTDVCAAYTLPRDGATYADQTPPIGRPICNTQLYVLDAQLQPVPIGVTGEIYIGGAGVGGGYLHRPEMTAERFIPDHLAPDAAPGALLYKTGDQGRWRADGLLDYLGRNDFQVKIRGFRIELGEIESRLVACAGVREAIVIARDDVPGEKRLVAYLMPAEGATLDANALRAELVASLADYMVPSAFVVLPAFPLTPSGKVDRKALPRPDRKRPELAVPYQSPVGDFEAAACAAFAEVLEIDRAGREDNFFDLGGSSLQAVRVLAILATRTGQTLSAPTIFAHATPAALARAASGESANTALAMPRRHASERAAFLNEPIAIIGMAGRFPGARTVEALWDNLIAGRDGITKFTLDTLDPSVPESLRQDPTYVQARGVLDDVECFDAAFFGISGREAELMDPQHRLFLELSWECLERAGYAPDRMLQSVGVFGGIYNDSYLQHHLMAHPEAMERAGDLQVLLSNDKDYAALRVAHKLNLKGPAVAVHTSCSTSLVAIAQAVDNLRLGRCDMAIAGGVTISSPSRTGYFHNDGSMLSSDGHTRTFDAGANGTVFNDGAAFVLLKPLSTALADGDEVFALIRSVATNNDGGGKASFTAPSVDGQAAVIAMAHREAGVDARSISYVEAHGTATPLGDPVEVEALTRAFRLGTQDTGFCRIGSLKSNIGHMVTAAGAGGMIKTALALHAQQLPATIHYSAPNPKIDFARTPFTVNAALTAWPRSGDGPRRAGVSNFGVGGTNAHAVLEEAPLIPESAPARGAQLLQLSARTPAALDAMAAALADHLEAHGESQNLADVAHTLQHGRSAFAQRLCVAGDSREAIVSALRSTAGSPARVQRALGAAVPSLVWLFPGQGAQYAGMGSGLYAQDPAFREAFDECMAALRDAMPFDLQARMFEGDPDSLVATATTQPATFCLEYALARSWLARGARPVALVGHSVGEFVAAVLAGVMPLADAARLVARRGAMMQALPAGSMLSVRLAADKLLAMLPASLSLAAENGPTACVVAGPTGELEAWQGKLEREGIVARLLQTSHAFHSAMMEPAVAPFEAAVREVPLAAPSIPIVSTLTGTWMSAADATDPRYWARHLRAPVRFSPALRIAIARHEDAAFLEIGPRGTLSTLARQHTTAGKSAPVAVASLGDTAEAEATQSLLAQGQLWTLGVALTAANASPADGRRRVRLPTYPFERKRFWLEAAPAVTVTIAAAAPLPPQPTTVMPTVMSTVPPSTAPTDRRPQLVARLRELFEDIAGVDLGAAEGSSNFVELGLDSLTLTQAAMQVKRKFGVALSFRQLMESQRSFDALAAFLDAALPPEAAPAMVTPAAVVAPVAAATAPVALHSVMVAPVMAAAPVFSAAPPDSLMQQVIAQQMQLMAQQLALLGGGAQAMQPIAAPAPALPQPSAVAAAAVPAQAAQPLATTPAADEAGPMRYDVKKAFGAIARIHTQPGALTDRQRARLDAFIRRYVERTQKSKAFTVAHRSHLADPRVVNGFRPMTKEITYQIVVERTKGSRMWDLDGNEYVDALNGFGMSVLGWQPDFINEAVHRQLDIGYEIGPMHPLAGDVARLLCELTGFDRAGLCNTGSEAVMAAIRIARTVTARNIIVTFTGSYHGTFDEVLVRAGRGGKGIPAAPGIMSGVFGDICVLDYGTPEALEWIRSNADDIAAVLVEPVQSRRPDFQPREFLKEVREITAKSGTCLIFDEVITGFRSHLGGAQALFGVRADLACYGKVIGGGFPIGAVAGKREFMDALDGGAWSYGDDSVPTVGVTYFAGTFVRHPLALAAAKASLEHFKQAGTALQTQLNVHTAAMADELTAFCREAGAPIEIRYFSSLWRVTWLEDHPLQDLLFAMMRSRGVHILDNFPCFMTTAHSQQDIATIKSAFKESVAELQEAEMLPRAHSSKTLDASHPPAPDARLGRDKDGQPAWFVPDPTAQGKFTKYQA